MAPLTDGLYSQLKNKREKNGQKVQSSPLGMLNLLFRWSRWLMFLMKHYFNACSGCQDSQNKSAIHQHVACKDVSNLDVSWCWEDIGADLTEWPSSMLQTLSWKILSNHRSKWQNPLSRSGSH